MQRIEKIEDMRRWSRKTRAAGERVVLVPTMGCLHEGHFSLIRHASAQGERTVVSLFVNPTQFGPGEDFEEYPRQLQRDLDALQALQVDVAFCPDRSAMYPKGFATTVSVAGLTRGLCGAGRPGHFEGVATVVCKLFHIIEPDMAVFGKKDYQQWLVIQKMVEDLDMAVRIDGCPIVREADGIALSSRNRYLSAPQRVQARLLNRVLAWIDRWALAGDASVETLTERALAFLQEEADDTFQLEYLQFVDSDTLQVLKKDALPAPGSTVAIAARVGSTRLIDNIQLGGR